MKNFEVAIIAMFNEVKENILNEWKYRTFQQKTEKYKRETKGYFTNVNYETSNSQNELIWKMEIKKILQIQI